MNRPVKFLLAVVSMVILLYPFSASFAKEANQAKVDVEPGLSSDVVKDEGAMGEGTPRSTRLDEQDKYNRRYKEYVESINRAESDEERHRLRREFDEETRAYRNSLAEEKMNLEKRDIEKEKQILTNEYHKKLRQLEQTHDQRERRLDKECRRVAVGAEKNWETLEPAMCQEKTLREAEFKRSLKSLENDYNASLQELQKSR